MESYITFDDIMEGFRKMAANNEVVDPQRALNGAIKLNSLLMGEVERLIVLEHDVAVMKRDCLARGDTASAAKMNVEASEEYKQMRMQGARVKNAQELILIVKKNATLTSELMRSALA